MKDLKGVEQYNYWRHVAKKAQFVLNKKEVADKTLLKNLNSMLYNVGSRIKKIDNIKPFMFKSKKPNKK